MYQEGIDQHILLIIGIPECDATQKPEEISFAGSACSQSVSNRFHNIFVLRKGVFASMDAGSAFNQSVSNRFHKIFVLRKGIVASMHAAVWASRNNALVLRSFHPQQ